MVQQHRADKHPLFIHKAVTSGPSQVLIVSAVYLLGYFGPEAEPLRACGSLVGKAAVPPQPANREAYG